MESFSYKDHILGANTSAGWSDLRALTQNQTGPCYLYNRHSIQRRTDSLIKSLEGVDFKIHYAIKANGNTEILQVLRQKGLGVDVVSQGEARWSLENGFKPEDVIFSGVAKSKEDLNFAIESNLYQINVESLPELERAGQIAQQLKKAARIGLRLNPNIKVDTHPYITTGFRENKFGMAEYQIREALQIVKKYAPYLELRGVSSHIGSQIRELSPLMGAVDSLIRTTRELMAEGCPISTIDLGGGVGIDYTTSNETAELFMMESFYQEAVKKLKELPVRVMLEPGRALVARSGVLLTQVEYIKHNGFKDFVIVNSGMNHLLRPSLYEAFHRILPLQVRSDAPEKIYDVVGPICESSDVLGRNRAFHEPQEGDWMAVMDAGAYGMTMASFYNRHAFPTEIFI